MGRFPPGLLDLRMRMQAQACRDRIPPRGTRPAPGPANLKKFAKDMKNLIAVAEASLSPYQNIIKLGSSLYSRGD